MQKPLQKLSLKAEQ